MYAVAGNVPSQTGDVNIAFFLSKVTSVIYKSSHVGSNWVFEWNLDSPVVSKQSLIKHCGVCMQVCREPKEHLQGYLKVPQLCT